MGCAQFGTLQAASRREISSLPVSDAVEPPQAQPRYLIEDRVGIKPATQAGSDSEPRQIQVKGDSDSEKEVS